MVKIRTRDYNDSPHNVFGTGVVTPVILASSGTRGSLSCWFDLMFQGGGGEGAGDPVPDVYSGRPHKLSGD